MKKTGLILLLVILLFSGYSQKSSAAYANTEVGLITMDTMTAAVISEYATMEKILRLLLKCA